MHTYNKISITTENNNIGARNGMILRKKNLQDSPIEWLSNFGVGKKSCRAIVANYVNVEVSYI